MDKPQIDALAERVESLERENRTLKRLGVGVIAALTVLGVGGAALQADATFSTITARKLVIVGPDNDRRIELDILQNGAAALRVFSRNGVQVVDMGSRLGGRGIVTINDEAGNQIWTTP